MYNNSNLEKKAKYTFEELKKMESALSSIEKYKNMKNEIIKNNSIFGSVFTSLVDEYVNEAEKLIKKEYNLNKPIVSKEEKKPLKQKENNTPKRFIDDLGESQKKQINKLVDEFMKTVICPQVNLDNKKYAGLFEGLVNYSAWLYKHK